MEVQELEAYPQGVAGETAEAAWRVARGFATSLAAGGDGSAPVPDSAWTVGEHAAHVYRATKAFWDIVTGRRMDWPGNDRELELFPLRDGQALAGLILVQTRSLLAALAAAGEGQWCHPNFGPMDAGEWTAYALLHLLMHAHPVACALGLPSPLEDAHAQLVLPFAWHVYPHIVDRGQRLSGRLEVRLSGDPAFWLDLRDGGAAVERAAAGPVDGWLDAEPAAFLLIALRFESQGAATRRGAVSVGGRAPWLGADFAGLFPVP